MESRHSFWEANSQGEKTWQEPGAGGAGELGKIQSLYVGPSAGGEDCPSVESQAWGGGGALVAWRGGGAVLQGPGSPEDL